MSGRPQGDIDLVQQVESAIWERGARREGKETRFRCPAHDDHDPSARWNRGKQVWHCQVCGAGGGLRSLASALGFSVEDQGLTVEELVEAKGLEVAFLRSLGVGDGVAGHQRRPCVDIPYMDGWGQVLAVRKRLRLFGEPRFVWRRGDHALPYGLWRLRDARSLNQLLLVEGESDCWTLWSAGIAALGIPGASSWRSEWVEYLAGIERVLLWREPDKGGDTLIPKVAATFPAVRIIEAPADAKDPNALWLACGQELAAFGARMRELAQAARPYSELRARVQGAAAEKDLEVARHLLEDPFLLSRIGDTLQDLGLAGERANALALYLVLSSRVTEEPLSAVLKGPSAAGKNFLVDKTRCLFPGDALYSLTAASERALIYTEEPLAHRTIVIAETHEAPFFDYVLRSLLSEGRIEYETIEKTPEGLRARRIVKQGPTGLVLTTTKSTLHPENETRLLTLELRDDPEQTAQVLMAVARRYQGDRGPMDLAPWHALQRWLASPLAAHQATIPFAEALAQCLRGRKEVRLRRDFGKLLSAIATCAVLHQLQREVRDGDVVADMRDYALVREIMAPIFGQTIAGGLTSAQREAVEAVAALYRETEGPASYSAVAQRLGLETSSAHRRLQNPLRLSYVVNEQTKERGPALLVPGTPLLEEEEVLPTVEAVAWVMQGVPS